jgi:succinoglycan biosynthesis transport protein ExoP
MQTAPPPKDDAALNVDVRQAWEVVRKRKWVILLVTLAVVSATAAHNLRQTPVYAAACSIVIDPSAPRVLAGVEEVTPMGAGSFWTNSDFYETEYKILASRAVAEIVVDQLGLDKDPAFGAKAADGVLARQVITPVKGSHMVLIEYRDTNALRAAELANAHANAYRQYNMRRRTEGSKNVTENLAEAKQRLEEVEGNLYTFRKKNNALAESLDDSIKRVKTTIEERSRRIEKLKDDRIAIEARLGEINRAKGDEKAREALPDVMNNAEVANLSRARLELETKLVQLGVRYGDKYPQYDETLKQKNALHVRLHAEIDKIIAGIEAEHRIAVELEKQNATELQRALAESARLNELLPSETKHKEAIAQVLGLYGKVTQGMRETDLTKDVKNDNVRIVDKAEVPGAPFYPRTRNNVALSALAGLLLGLALAFLLNYIDSSVKTQDDVERVLGLTFLGIIPTAATAKPRKDALSERDRDLYMFEHQRSQLAECARSIRTNITFMGADKPIKRMLIVSAKPEEGKTSTAVTLATTMALSGHKTLLVDTDMRRPRLHRVFGVGSEIGMSSYLLGERPLSDVLKRTVVPGLDVLPCGPLPPAPAELLHTAAFAALVKELSDRYDRVIFDSPPIVAVTDAPVLSALVDGVVFVVKAGATSRDLVKQAIAQMRGANAPVLGAILNDVDLQNRAYGYYYAYYRQYGSYAEDEIKPS